MNGRKAHVRLSFRMDVRDIARIFRAQRKRGMYATSPGGLVRDWLHIQIDKELRAESSVTQAVETLKQAGLLRVSHKDGTLTKDLAEESQRGVIACEQEAEDEQFDEQLAAAAMQTLDELMNEED